MDSATSSAEFFKNIMERIKKSSNEVIDMGLRSNNYGQNTLSFIDKNQLSVLDKEPVSPGELPEFMKKLLIFKPYTRSTIVKGYDLSFEMPKGGLGNILAIQSSNKIGSTQSINNILDGFVKYEELNRIKENNSDIFVRYNPSIGKNLVRDLYVIIKEIVLIFQKMS